MTRKEIMKHLRMTTPNQMKEICKMLYLDYDFMRLYFIERNRYFDLEAKLNMSHNKIIKEMDLSIKRIMNALNDKSTDKKIRKLLNLF